MGQRIDSCLHESAHSVVRQLLMGDLKEMGFKKRAAYSYPVERRRFDEIGREKLGKIAVVVEAGIIAERRLCSDLGNESLKEYAIADDVRQLKGIQRIAEFSDEQMEVLCGNRSPNTPVSAMRLLHQYPQCDCSPAATPPLTTVS